MKIFKFLKEKTAVGSTFLMVVLALICYQGSAQAQETVSGVVKSSEDGFPIIGATIQKVGSNVYATTDFDGQYTIKAKVGDQIKFSYLGMNTVILKVTSATLNATLDPSAESLEEVVVVGYGAVKKKEITGAVAQVKSEEIEKFVTTDISSALQGQVSGVSVVANSGEPGESASIQIRGVTSISGSNEPLWVVDGIAQQGNPGLTPNEIETIDILKDAASTAIYGAEGAAGVILVTTKQGKEGTMKVSINSSYGVRNLGTSLDLMNTQETLFYQKTRVDNGASNNAIGPIRNFEWLNNDNDFSNYVLVDNAPVSQHTLNFSGGAKGFSYNAVLGYYDEEGTVINSEFKRLNSRINATYKTDNWRINGSIAVTSDKRERTANNVITNAIRFFPYFPQVDLNSDVVYTDGNGGSTTASNNLVESLRRKNSVVNDRINGAIKVNRKLTKDLTIGATAGIAILNSNSHEFLPRTTVIDVTGDNPPEIDVTRSSVIMRNSRTVTVSADANVNYRKKFGDHQFGVQGIFAIKEVSRKSFDAREQGVLNNSIDNFFTTSVNPVVGSGTYDSRGNLTGTDFSTKLIGLVGRLTYDYKGKYLLSGIVRRDGYSAFTNNTWGTFPSVALAWNVTDEDFWQPFKSTVNNFKFRVSRGVVGNNRVGNVYSASSLVTPDADYVFDENDSSVSAGSAIRRFSNEKLQWETTISDNFGVDLAFFNNKLTVTADYYDTERQDMLFPVRLPGSSGVYVGNANTNVTLNVGNMTNRGFELAARYRNRINKFKYDVSGTFTKNKNEITNLFNTNLIINSNSALVSGTQETTTALIKGREVGAFYLYETNGVIKTEEQLINYRKLKPDARLGDLMYVDTNGNGKIGIDDADDRVYKGSALPDYELGFNLKLDYAGFDLSTNWYASVGSEIMNGNSATAYQSDRHKDLVNQWSVDNRNSNIPLNRGEQKTRVSYLGDTDYWLEDGSYIRLRIATLGYTFDKSVCEKLNISQLRVYLNAQNPLTFTKYKGYDPEVGGNVARRGLDTSNYPLTSLYTLGLNLKF